MYEAPHRLIKTLKMLGERLGDRRVSVCRELTKRHETVYRSTLLEAVSYYEENLPKGECVLVIEGLKRSSRKSKRSGVICRSKNIWSIICRRESIKKKR